MVDWALKQQFPFRYHGHPGSTVMVDWALKNSFHSFTREFCCSLKLKLKATDTDNTESYPYQFRKKDKRNRMTASVLKQDPNIKRFK